MTDWERTYKDLKIRNWIVLLILAFLCFFLFESSLTFGVILGGFISIANFSFLQCTILNGLADKGGLRSKKAILLVKSFLRLFILAIVIYILITRGIVNPVGFAIGFSTIVVSIVSYGINRALRTGIEGAV